MNYMLRYSKSLLMAISTLLLPLAAAMAQGEGADSNRPDGAGSPEMQRVLIAFEDFPGEAEENLVRAHGGEVNHTFWLVRAIAAKIPEPAWEGLERNPNVRFVEPDVEVEALDQDPQVVPWGIDRIFGNETYPFDTWEVARGEPVAVAVLDTGIDALHEDLEHNVMGGTNTIDDTPWQGDPHGHGTHVSGTIAALDNAVGVVGVGPDISLFGVKVLNDNGFGTASSVAAGIEWAVGRGIPIINMSLGGSAESQVRREACEAAYEKGHLLVAAAGNSGENGNILFPARYESVIAVAASTPEDERTWFSSTGPQVELIAPGLDVLSTESGGGYFEASGTSMASPHVAGVAALVWAANDSLSPIDDVRQNEAVRQFLRQTSEDLGLERAHQGDGLVRADRAVAFADEMGIDPSGTGHLVGSVTAADNGFGLGGVDVSLEGDAETLFTTTDHEGRFNFVYLPEGDYELSFEVDLIFEEPEPQTVTVSDGETVWKDVELVPRSYESLMRVSAIDFPTQGPHQEFWVRVTNPYGEPVEGAEVALEIYHHEDSCWSTSNMDLFASISGGVTGSGGWAGWRVRHAPDGVWRINMLSVEHEDYVWERDASLVIQCSSDPAGAIEGVVADAETGEPIAGANVILDSWGMSPDGEARITRTDPDGFYRMEGARNYNIRPGPWTVHARAEAPGYAALSDSVRVWSNRTSELDFDLELLVEAPVGAIEGTVTDADTGEGLQGAVVAVLDTGLETETDSTGAYRIDGIEEGPHTVTASAIGYWGAEVETEVAADSVTPVSFELEAAPPGSIEGIVVTEDTGEGIAGATVLVLDTGDSVTTGVDGSYAIDSLLAGTYAVNVSAEGFFDASKNVTVESGGATTANFELTPLPGALEGTIMDAETGEGIAGASVIAGPRWGSTNENGDYRLEEVPVGTHNVWVGATGYESVTEEDVEIRTQETTTLDLALEPVEPSGPEIDSLVVTDESNRRWARVQVDWEVSAEEGNLATVETVMSLDGTVIDSETSSVSGSAAEGDHHLRERDGHGETYDITLTVTDSEGNDTSETREIEL